MRVRVRVNRKYDFMTGGDLMNLLIKMEIFDEPFARFYIAELICAIESVHKMGFIHRYVKRMETKNKIFFVTDVNFPATSNQTMS